MLPVSTQLGKRRLAKHRVIPGEITHALRSCRSQDKSILRSGRRVMKCGPPATRWHENPVEYPAVTDQVRRSQSACCECGLGGVGSPAAPGISGTRQAMPMGAALWGRHVPSVAHPMRRIRNWGVMVPAHAARGRGIEYPALLHCGVSQIVRHAWGEPDARSQLLRASTGSGATRQYRHRS